MSIRAKIQNPKVQQAELAGAETPKEFLLDQLETGGVKWPYGCRAGSCGACRVKVVRGAELLKEPGLMERDTLVRCGDSKDIRLACRTEFLKSDGVLEIDQAPEIPSGLDY